MKRFFCLLLAICLLSPCLPLAGRAEVAGECGDDLQWVFSDGTLTVSGSGPMFSYAYEEAPWCLGNMDVRQVILEEGVTSVGSFAFRDCTSLEALVLPASLESVGQGAFSGCESLASVSIPDIAPWMDVSFEVWYEELYDSSLGAWKEIQVCSNPLGANDSVILCVNGEAATTLVLPEGLTAIGSNSFRDYKRLTALYLPVSVRAVGDYAFTGSGLTDVYYSGTPTQVASIQYGEDRATLMQAQWHWGEEAHSHSFGDWETVTAPTCAAPGVACRWCDSCDEVETRPIPQTPTVTLSADAATGMPRLTWNTVENADKYRIYRSTSEDGTFVYLATSTVGTYADTSVEAGSSYWYKVRALDSEAGLYSGYSPVVAFAASAVNIVTQPKSVWVPEGDKATVTLEVTGDGLTYRWYYKNPGASKYSYTSSFTGNSYSITMSEARDGRYVYCKVTDTYGNTVKSKTVSLNMQTPLEILTQPKSVKVAEGKKATVTVEAQGDGLTYKWYYKNPGASKYTYTASFTGNSYSITMNEDRDGRYVFCRVYDKYGNMVKTNTVSLRMK